MSKKTKVGNLPSGGMRKPVNHSDCTERDNDGDDAGEKVFISIFHV